MLLRRAYFDLLGLPPTPAEIDDYLSDTATDAWPRLIERLLASPHYGERWGRHWLDVVRYADTAGDNADYPVPEARLYRDYVLDAFQHDKPFDEFIREQLAGDILAANPSTDDARRREQIIATGYLALARRYATAPYELWHLTLEDAIDTTGRAFLGLSLRCARCHDHKYDPITQSDYYALYGIFASTQFPWAGGEEFHSKKSPRQHFTPLVPDADVAARAAELEATIARCQADFETAKAAKDERPTKKLRQQLDVLNLQKQYGVPPHILAAYAVHEGTPVDAPIQQRGEPNNPGRVVPRGVPKFLAGQNPPKIPSQASGRLELANWLASSTNPLTARVMANRIWQWHFGRGLVATPSDFGLRGAPPTNRELLDWLAGRLIASGWSIKSLHRDIMLSETYQLASQDSSAEFAANAARDPDNLHHWRFNRLRLDAESLRDALLTASGQLDLARPGPHPFPPVSEWRWTQHAPFKAVYDSPHRSVYLMTQRFARHPYLALFDGPDPNTSTGLRTSSIVPTQALYLLNNPFVTAASPWAGRPLDRSLPRRAGPHRTRLPNLLVAPSHVRRSPASRRLHHPPHSGTSPIGTATNATRIRSLDKLRPRVVRLTRVQLRRLNRNEPLTGSPMARNRIQSIDRRSFITGCAAGSTGAALALRATLSSAVELHGGSLLAPLPTHFPARAERLLFIYLTGGFSHVDTFDYKPALAKDGGRELTTRQLRDSPTAKLMPSPFKFSPHGESGLVVSELFPNLGGLADELCVIRSMHTDIVEHFQATLAMHTGSSTVPMPSIGAWISFALGSHNLNLPSHVVLAEHLPYAGAQVFDCSFLPPEHQGVRVIPGDKPIPDLRTPAQNATLAQLEAQMLSDVNEFYARHRADDLNLPARAASFETARGMMRTAPEAFDLTRESAATLSLYGADGRGPQLFRSPMSPCATTARTRRARCRTHRHWHAG